MKLQQSRSELAASARASMPLNAFGPFLRRYLEAKPELMRQMLFPELPAGVRFLDTTLRDGEQGVPGGFTLKEKTMVARALDRAGVEIIEGGFAATGNHEVKALKKLANTYEPGRVASLARSLEKNFKDIDDVARSGAGRISLVASTSPNHIRTKLGLTEEQFVKGVLLSVERAKKYGLYVELLAEDGSRTHPAFLKEMFLRSRNAGADGFCVCDTVGVLVPEYVQALYIYLKNEGVPNLGFHGHNDMDLVVANSLAAVRGGATLIHETVNGIGERTGNCPLESMALNLALQYGIGTVALERLFLLSQVVADNSNLFPHSGKPIVGENAFATQAGMHIAALMLDTNLYEPYDPALVGNMRRVDLGRKAGGKGALKYIREGLGLNIPQDKETEFLRLVHEVDTLEEHVSVADLELLAKKVRGEVHETITIAKLQVTIDMDESVARLKLRRNGDPELHEAVIPSNSGPVDAVYTAMNQALGENIKLLNYRVEPIRGESDAKTHIRVHVQKGNRKVWASAADNNIVVASAKAYVKGLNVLL